MPPESLKEKRQTTVKTYQTHEKDTGSPEVQVALITERVNHLSVHLKSHPKDFGSRRGLLVMVGRRASLLKYLATHNHDRYQSIIQRLGLRR